MEKKTKNLSDPRLKELQKDLKRIQKGEKFLEIERGKLSKKKEAVRKKIKKEKEIFSLKNRIKRLNSTKR